MIAEIARDLLSPQMETPVPQYVEETISDPDTPPFDLWAFCQSETDHSLPLIGIRLLVPCKFLGNRHAIGTILHYPCAKAKKLIDLGIAHEVVPDNRLEVVQEPRIQKIERATTPDELIGAMADYVPGLLSDPELVELTRAYESKMAEFMPEEWPETSLGQATLPGPPESGQRSQESWHPARITHSLAWDGQEVVILPRCGECQHFTRDTINPASGLGDCEVFLLPDGKRQIGRYPMQHPKTATCFEKGESK